jgi:hypothetical protein
MLPRRNRSRCELATEENIGKGTLCNWRLAVREPGAPPLARVPGAATVESAMVMGSDQLVIERGVARGNSGQ